MHFSAPLYQSRSATTDKLLRDSPFPVGSYSWVKYSRQRTVSFSKHYASDLSLLKADALWCENERCLDSKTWPMDPKQSVLPTTPQTHYNTTPHIVPLASGSAAWLTQRSRRSFIFTGGFPGIFDFARSTGYTAKTARRRPTTDKWSGCF